MLCSCDAKVCIMESNTSTLFKKKKNKQTQKCRLFCLKFNLKTCHCPTGEEKGSAKSLNLIQFILDIAWQSEESISVEDQKPTS